MNKQTLKIQDKDSKKLTSFFDESLMKQPKKGCHSCGSKKRRTISE